MTDANSTVGTLSCLSSLALITVSGADRFTFLQGQLTNDVTKLSNGLMPAGYCSPKGRLLATPRLFQEGDTIGMIVAASNADYLVKRLKMYVLRSKVTIERAADREVAGFVGSAPTNLGDGALVFELPCALPQARIAAALPCGLGLAIVPKGTLAPARNPSGGPPAPLPVNPGCLAKRQSASRRTPSIWISSEASPLIRAATPARKWLAASSTSARRTAGPFCLRPTIRLNSRPVPI